MSDERRSADQGERRATDRRRYNRRSTDEVSPPYFEAFERIAIALEGIQRQLSRAQIVLPDRPAAAPEPRASHR